MTSNSTLAPPPRWRGRAPIALTWIALTAGATLVAAGAYLSFERGRIASEYRTAVVDHGPIQLAIASTGNLKAVITVDVGSQLSGQIASVEGDFNQHVHANQPIAHIDPSTYQIRLAQAQADLASAEASVSAANAAARDADVTLKSAARDLVRREALKQKGLIAQTDLDAAQLTLDQATARRGSAAAQIQVAEATVKQKRAALANSQLDLNRTVITAPVDGVIVLRNVQPGQTVAASFQTPVLFQIAEDLTQMELDLNTDEADVGQIHEGQDVHFRVDAFPNRVFRGKVEQIRLSALTVQNVVTYPVVVIIQNTDLTLLPGMTANAVIDVGGIADALRVPNGALRFRPPESTAPPPASGRGGKIEWKALGKKLQLNEDQKKLFDTAVEAIREQKQAKQVQGSGQARKTASAAEPSAASETGATGESRRNRASDALNTALQPLRAMLSDTQRQVLDRELSQAASARHGTVWVLEGAHLKAVAVQVGIVDAEHTQVLGDALKVGDEVVIGSTPHGS